MKSKAISMKREIRTISKYRALIISKYYFAFLLISTSLYLGLLKYAMSPLYIVIVLYSLPPILNSLIRDYTQKNNSKFLINIVTDEPFLLNNLKSKYNYSKLNSFTNGISFFIALLLIGLWQYNFSTIVRINELLQIVPILIFSTGLILRYLGVIFYQIKLPQDLSNNRVK